MGLLRRGVSARIDWTAPIGEWKALYKSRETCGRFSGLLVTDRMAGNICSWDVAMIPAIARDDSTAIARVCLFCLLSQPLLEAVQHSITSTILIATLNYIR